MTTLSLTKTETAVLAAGAEHPEGLVVLPERMTPAGRQRLLGRFLRDRLATERDGEHHVTPAGYKAIDLSPPRRARSANSAVATETGGTRPGRKLEMVRAMLARPDGATLAELVAATGWLPHTTRAALSRIRSAGQPLAKPRRADGTAAYRIEPAAPEAAPARRGWRRTAEVTQAAA